MAIDDPAIVDAIGIVRTGMVVLTILDSWDWEEAKSHLLALQSKLNAYFDFIEEGKLERGVS